MNNINKNNINKIRKLFDGKNELYKCVTIKGYDIAKILYNSLEDKNKEFLEKDYLALQNILIKNYEEKKELEQEIDKVLLYFKEEGSTSFSLDLFKTVLKSICKIFNLDSRLNEINKLGGEDYE